MAVIETKFSIGDVVWVARTTTENRSHKCPDCLGERNWKATSPAGGEFEVPCPRCSVSYSARDELRLTYQVFTAAPQRITIGQVRASSGGSESRGHEYMAYETGIGSGSLYYESDLFQTEEEARKVAQARADLTNEQPDFWVAKQYNKTARFCDYQLKDALMKAAVDGAYNTTRKAEYLILDIEEASSLSDVRAAVQAWRDRDGEATTATEAA